jgi:hypothetical protein
VRYGRKIVKPKSLAGEISEPLRFAPEQGL